jgi:hypothetical protein
MVKRELGVVVACSLGQAELAERRERWRRLRARAGLDVEETEAGLRLGFRRQPGVEEELAELAALERECCGFADWSVSAGDSTLVLDVTGGSETAVAAVQAMFRA